MDVTAAPAIIVVTRTKLVAASFGRAELLKGHVLAATVSPKNAFMGEG
jgi:hypothetical protein